MSSTGKENGFDRLTRPRGSLVSHGSVNPQVAKTHRSALLAGDRVPASHGGAIDQFEILKLLS
jgi:hypothetical protein